MAKVIGFNPVDLGYGGMKNYSGSDNNKILEIRITKGVARYTQAFTPNTVEFPQL